MIPTTWPLEAPQGAPYNLHGIAGVAEADLTTYAQRAAEAFRERFGELPQFGFVHLRYLWLGPLPERER